MICLSIRKFLNRDLAMIQTTAITIGRRLSAVAVAGLCWVLFTAAVNAQCSNDCGPGDTTICSGSSTGSCPGCVSSPLACSNSPGITYFTGVVIHGSIMGTKTVAFPSIPCRKKKPCISGGIVQGSCSALGCYTAGFGGCETCTLGLPITVGTHLDCQITNNCGG